jgi:hypothetical protein
MKMAPARFASALLAVFWLGAGLASAQGPSITEPPPPIVFDDWKKVSTTDETVEYSESFPSAVTTPYPSNNVVPLRILVPASAKGPVPVVVVTHYWGAKDLKVEVSLASELNRRGIAAAILTLPYHLSRTPPGFRSGQLAIEADPERLVETMTQAVLDTRRAIDFLQTKPEFRGDEVGIAGTSLGAVVSILTYALDPRITHAAFLLGGVDVAHILWSSSRVVQQRDALRQLGYTEATLRPVLRSIEPLTYLPRATPGSTFVIGARYDTVIPSSSTSKLIENLPHPKVLWIDTGHYGGVFVQRRLLREVASFFGAEMESGTYTPPARIYAPTVRLGVIADTLAGLNLGVGVDLAKFDSRGNTFSTLFATPKGPELFLGRVISNGLSFGLSGSTHGVGVGFFFSTVL